MDLQALYDLKERLEHAAIAGTGLLQEDFRLKRAVEALTPLAAASPVFAKITSASEALLAAPPEGRGKQLLDVLSLVDAVAYTQGTVDMPGELKPLEGGHGTYVQVSYGQLRPLLTALTTTGGGRMEIIQSSWANHPEFFTDFRVLPALVASLQDSYGEISTLCANILKELGPTVLPLLKEGFDPAGLKAMAFRVDIISTLEGPAATPWLREILPKAKGAVRTNVILALGKDRANASLLLELVRMERGKNRETVLLALAQQEGQEIHDFWVEELETHTQSIYALNWTCTDWSCELVSSGLRKRLERFLTGETRPTEEESSDISMWCQAIGKKNSPAMLDFWRWADEHMEAIDKIKTDKNKSLFLGVALTDRLETILCAVGPGPLREFCLTLFDSHPSMTRYLILSFHAALLTLPAAEVYEKFSPYILTKKPILDAERKKTLNNVLIRALGAVSWNRKLGCHILTGGQPAAEPLDRRWFDLLVQVPDIDDTLRRLTPPDDPELCAKLAGCLYSRILDGGRFIQEDVAFLREHGWTQWKGFLDKKVRKDGSLTTYAAIRLLNETSLTGPEKAAELRRLAKIVQEQNAVKKRPAWPAQTVQKQIAAWEAE